jgi:transglutaminase-like putative cysteine protease
MPVVTVRLKNMEKHANDRGLLIPTPIESPEQKFVRFVGLPTAGLRVLRASLSDQQAYYMPGPFPETIEYGMEFETGSGHPPADFFERFDNRYTTASKELQDAVRSLAEGFEGIDEKVAAVVEFVASKFRYGSRNMSLEEPQLVCDVVRGNCIDINTMLMASLYAIDVECAYVAGYYFEAGTEPTTTGMHCWVATNSDGGLRYWDIAHYLKRDLRSVEPGLNPVDGARYAVSRGRGLRFEIDDEVTIETSHLIQPRWIIEDGKSVISSVTASLDAVWWDVDETSEAASMKAKWACKPTTQVEATAETAAERSPAQVS